MAEEKKSFIAYCDWLSIFEKLTDEEAGKLSKHLLRYVNDKNPVADNRLIELVFEPIKLQLKRDLNKWMDEKTNKSIGGRLGNLKRWNPDLYDKTVSKSITLEEAESIAEHRRASDTDKKASDGIASIAVNVNVTDTVNEEYKEKFNFKTELLNLGVESKIVSDWLTVRRKKKAANTETAFNRLKKEIEKSGLSANECIKIAAENSWQGFKSEWVNNETNSKNNNRGFKSDTTERTIKSISEKIEQEG